MSSCATAANFNVVILYDRPDDVSEAMATYQHLREELADDFTPNFHLWSIDHALAPAWAESAERDLAAAEVIIMAVDAAQPCPPEFQRWKRGAGQNGGRPPHAVIALLDASGDPAPGAESWSGVLRSSATQIHSEVFVYDPPARGEGALPSIDLDRPRWELAPV